MRETVDLEKARKEMSVRRGFRNWRTRFGEPFGVETLLPHISKRSLMMLAEGRDNSTFYLLDLIMNLQNLGSGFEFNDLPPKEKMKVMDSYLFLLDRVRFEWMKRLGWLEAYPGEEMPIVDLAVGPEELLSRLQSRTPLLSKQHPRFDEYCKMNGFEREELVRKLIPDALKAIENQSTTL
ncbi:MAG: hypothetical protein C4576_16485 [Desulfobacteraceae bacterium]|nr:MAG: hypothetical protein C4576_16485 [Desulfobacteraceae bacterium]